MQQRYPGPNFFFKKYQMLSANNMTVFLLHSLSRFHSLQNQTLRNPL